MTMEQFKNSVSDPSRAFEDMIRQAGGCLVIDGGLSTELEKHGVDLNDSLWSAGCLSSNPDLIHTVHMDYLRAGADVIITASYQATIQGFEAKGLNAEIGESLLRKSVSIARHARDRFWEEELVAAGIEKYGQRLRALVAASIGSYGAYLADGSEYRGNYGPDITVDYLKDFHRQRLVVLADSGPDLLALETIPSKLEAQALIELLDEEDVGVPAWISFSCKDGTRVSSGDLFADCAALANNSSRIVAVGVNCTPPRYIEDLLVAAKKVTAKPLVVYPNSGETWDGVSKSWVPTPPSFVGNDFIPSVTGWRDAGAKLIGGCCRTSPQTVCAIANLLRPG